MAFSWSLSPLLESATHIRSKVHRMAYTWTIDHFSYHCDEVLHRRAFLESPKFSPHKFDQERLQFFLRVHPRGNVEKAEETKDNVPIYLHMKSNKTKPVSIKAKVSIVKASSEKCHTKEDAKELSNNKFLGWDDFVRRDLLLNTNDGLLTDDKLTIHCEVVIQVMDEQLHNMLLKRESLNSIFQIETAKTCWQVDKFTHVLTIDNFSNLNLTGEFPSILSACFNSSAHPECKFQLKIYPNGDRPEANDHISIYLFLNTFVKDLYVKYVISLLNDKGEEYRKSHCKVIFISADSGLGWPKFISRATLFDTANRLLPDDKLTFSCEISNFLDIETTSSSSRSAAIQEAKTEFSQSELAICSGDLQQKILRTKRDITFVIGERTFPAHKLIFSARSPVFDKMFEHDFEENQTKQVTIADIEADVFEQFMKFVYSDKVDKLSEFDEKLLVVSDKYQMDSLKRICQASMSSKLCLENVICFLVLADMHNAEQLKADSIEFIKCEVSSIIKLDLFKDFQKPTRTCL